MGCKYECISCKSRNEGGEKIPAPPYISDDGLRQTVRPSCHVNAFDGPWVKVEQQNQEVPDEVRMQASG